jgi:hypothetical protein
MIVQNLLGHFIVNYASCLHEGLIFGGTCEVCAIFNGRIAFGAMKLILLCGKLDQGQLQNIYKYSI